MNNEQNTRDEELVTWFSKLDFRLYFERMSVQNRIAFHLKNDIQQYQLLAKYAILDLAQMVITESLKCKHY